MDLLVSVGVLFMVVAFVAYILGAKGIAGMSAGLGRLLLGIFLVLAIIIFLLRYMHNASS